MAIFESCIFGNLRQSVGNVTCYQAHGKNIMRSKRQHIKDCRSLLQLQQRTRMKAVQRLAGSLHPVLAVGFHKDSSIGRQNAFIRVNIAHIEVGDDRQACIRLEKLQLSSGEYAAPDVVARIDGTQGGVVFTQKSQPLRPSAPDDDRVYGAIVTADKNLRIRIYPLGLRGELRETVVPLPEEAGSGKCNLYAFTVGSNGRKTGQTICCMAGIPPYVIRT